MTQQREPLTAWLQHRINTLDEQMSYGSDLDNTDIAVFEEAKDRYKHYLAQAAIMQNTLKKIAEGICSNTEADCPACNAKAALKELA